MKFINISFILAYWRHADAKSNNIRRGDGKQGHRKLQLSCSNGEALFELNLVTDNYGAETTWALINNCDSSTLLSGGSPPYDNNVEENVLHCVPDAEYIFTIFDSNGDGICCSNGSGSYSVKYDSQLIVTGGQFASLESTSFGSCMPSTDGLCSKYDGDGWHRGTYEKSLPKELSPSGVQWRWEECARECASFAACEFWTLRLGGDKACLLMSKQGTYSDTGGHVEGLKDLDCLGMGALMSSPTQAPTPLPTPSPTATPTASPTSNPTATPTTAAPVPVTPKFKRGIAFHTAQSCNTLENHSASTWWYSWATTAGFSNGFCTDPNAASENARNNLGKEFVPMFWNSIPPQPFTAEQEANLQNATYLMTFNEPERSDQANISPTNAATMWPKIISIATQYNLQLIAPCAIIDAGRTWYHEWLTACTNMYGQPCDFDFTCLHAYYQPQPCTGVGSWACINVAMSKIEGWLSDFGKPTWVSEFACNPWGGVPCNEQLQKELMQQFVPLLDASNAVFRYAWFSAYAKTFGEANTNEVIWEDNPKVTCKNKKWIAGFGNAGWQIKTLSQCLAKSERDPACYSPFALSMDKDNCYCSVDSCQVTVSSWQGMHTWRLLGTQESNALTPLGELYQLI